MNADLIKLINTIPSPPKDSKNGHYKNEYASLGSVTETVKKVLSSGGYTISQVFDGTVLVTLCIGPDGVELESRLQMPEGNGPNPFQVQGQAITYCRRYALVSMFCLNAGDVDDDAELTTWFNEERAREQATESNGTVPNVQNIPTGTPSRVL